MKIIYSLILVISVLYTTNTFSQKKSSSFVGTITYTVTPQGEIDPAVTAQLPTEIIMYYSGPKTRIEQKSAMGSVTIISNYDTKEQLILMDIMGQKYAIKSGKEETEATIAQTPKAEVTIGTETKTVAGYNCKKADFVQDGKTYTIWITEDLKIDNANWQTPYKDVNGVMLEYTQATGQDGDINLMFSAKEVSKGKVKDSMFTAPSGYQEMTIQEFKKMFGGASGE